MIQRIDTGGHSATQILSVLAGATVNDRNSDANEVGGTRNQEFTDTSVLDAPGARRPARPPPEESLDEVATDTQVLPPLLDFEDDSELDEALGENSDPDDADEGPFDEEMDSDSKLLAELEDLMGEKFEEQVV